MSQVFSSFPRNFPSTFIKQFWKPCQKFSPKSRGTFAEKQQKHKLNSFSSKKMLCFKKNLQARSMQVWQPCQNFWQKVQKSENYYTIIFFSKILFLVTKIFWKDGVQVWPPAERMFVKSLKAGLPTSENIYEKKILLNENFSRKTFSARRIKFIQSCSFFSKVPFLSKGQKQKQK